MAGFEPIPCNPVGVRLLKEAARTALSRLRRSRDPEVRAFASTLREPLHVWLDLIKAKERGFQRILQLTRWRGGQDVEAFLESGAMPSDARLTENGAIQQVFKASADFWDDLVAVGFDEEEVPSKSAPPPGARHISKAEQLIVSEQSADRGDKAKPLMNTQLIRQWMKQEGYTNAELADKLKTSKRTISSLLNNGRYHGREVVIKLANLMEKNEEDLYLS